MSIFANGREVSGKAQPNKIIAGFPSVCLSPPSPPAGPLPIPYPMFTDASKTTGGTKTVKVKKKEAGKANKSTYKSSKGNEPATRSFGMDVVTHKLSAATVHQAYSFDVKFEGKGANRFLDMTTTNHATPQAPATALTIDAAKLDPPTPPKPDKSQCDELSQDNKDARKKMGDHPRKAVRDTATGNTTVTHSVYTPVNGTPVKIKGCSRKVVQDGTWAEGKTLTPTELTDAKDRKPIKSDVCTGGHSYKTAHPKHRPHTSHTEARILEDITRDYPPGEGGNMGQIVMSIDWNASERRDDPVTGKKMRTKDNKFVMDQVKKKVPCEHCKDLLCEATTCMKVYLCNEEGEPEDFADQCL